MPKNEIREIPGYEKKVNELFKLEKEISDLKSKAEVIEGELKTSGSELITGFGSVNLLGADAIAQIQKRRPSISVLNGNIQEAEKLLGDKFKLFFDSITDGTEELRRDKIPELKKLIVGVGKDPGDFFTLHREAKANDTLLKEDVRNALLGKRAKDIFEKLMKLCSLKGALEGVLALRWSLRK